MVLEPLKEYLWFLFASLVLRTLRGLVHLSQIFPWSQELCWAQEGQRRTERVLVMKHTWPQAEETNLLEKEETEKCLEIQGTTKASWREGHLSPAWTGEVYFLGVHPFPKLPKISSALPSAENQGPLVGAPPGKATVFPVFVSWPFT